MYFDTTSIRGNLAASIYLQIHMYFHPELLYLLIQDDVYKIIHYLYYSIAYNSKKKNSTRQKKGVENRTSLNVPQ